MREAGRNLLDVMSYQHDCWGEWVLGELAKSRHQVFTCPEVESCGRFVEQEQFRIAHQGPGNENSLTFTFAECSDGALRKVAHTHGVEKVLGALFIAFVVVFAPPSRNGEGGGDHHIDGGFGGGNLTQHGRAGEPYAGTQFEDVDRADQFIQNHCVTASRKQRGRHDGEQSCLASAVGSEHDPAIGIFNDERQIVEDRCSRSHDPNILETHDFCHGMTLLRAFRAATARPTCRDYAGAYAAVVTPLIPRSGPVAVWATAYLRERVSMDDALSGIMQIGSPQRVDVDDESIAWALVLGRLRRDGVTALRLLLPAPGDVAGLPGPDELNRRAVAVGECAVTCDGPATAFIPVSERDDDAFRWEWSTAIHSRPWDTTVAQATRDLVDAMASGTEALEALDLAAGRDHVSSGLAAVENQLSGLVLPSSYPARAIDLIGRGTRLWGALLLAQANDGAAVTASEAVARSQVLAPLTRAARHAIAAGYSAGASAI